TPARENPSAPVAPPELTSIPSSSRPSPSRSVGSNTYAHSPPWQSANGSRSVWPDPNRIKSSCDESFANTSPPRAQDTTPEAISTTSASSAIRSPSKSPEVVACVHRDTKTVGDGASPCTGTGFQLGRLFRSEEHTSELQ